MYLRTLPGAGAYTSAAVASFAGEERTAPADTNIGRVLARSRLGLASVRDASPAAIAREAEARLPADGAEVRAHNLALMDLGALVCTVRDPDCERCPLRVGCRWRLAGRPAAAKASRPAPPFPETARFARGRIVDALRAAASLTAGEIVALLPERHRPEAGRYLLALQRDGVIDGEGDRWWLAGHSGRSSIASPKE
jgi:A/G-specific adenine glycosylase